MKLYELTSSQKLIYSSQKVLGIEAVVLIGNCLIKNETDIFRLEASVKEVVSECDSFKIRIVETEDGIRQYFVEETDYNITTCYFETREKFDEYVKTLVDVKFEDEGVLHKIIVAKVGDDALGIATVFHHIVIDAWGSIKLLNWILEAYYGYFNKEKIASYLSYMQEEKVYLESDSYKKALQYWLERYEKIGEYEEIYPRKANDLSVKRKEFVLEKELSKSVDGFLKQYNISPYCFFITIIAIYMKIFGKKNSLYIGTTMLNRKNMEQKNTVGMFVNTIPLGFELKDDISFLSLMYETRKNIWDAFRYQCCNYGQLLNELRNSNSVTRGLYDVVFNYQNAAVQDKFNNCEVVWTEPKIQGNPLQIHVSNYMNQDGYCFMMDYHTHLFENEEILILFEHLCHIMKQGIEQPDIKLRNLSYISEKEKERVLFEFNSEIMEQKKTTAIEVFEKHVKQNKNHIAVRFEEIDITYGELNRKANQFAYFLQNNQIQKGHVVAIMATRSVEMIIGILAILKVGAIYVPIDASYPEERIQYMLQDSGAKVIVTNCFDCCKQFEIPVLNLNNEKSYSVIDDNLHCNIESDDLAYLIYTSGTTGRPKPVAISHGNLFNLVWVFKKMGIRSDDAVLQFANLVFDASVWEIWMAFMTGATLVVVSSDLLLNEKKFIEVAQKYGITVATLPPRYFLQVKNIKLRVLITAGSEASKEIIEAIGEDTIYYNAYGPTENTVDTTIWKYEKGDIVGRRIPIGKPIPNVQVYIMDHDKLCGIGIPGEICVTGLSVSKGYYKKPELTDERFEKNPFGGGYMYHTGDIGAWLPDGNIDFLGRKDNQVKINGFRIEISEVESACRKIDAVTNVAVIDAMEHDGNRVLRAFFVSDDRLDMENVRNELGKYLPQYMIPAFMVQIPSIPVTKSGKINEKALRDMKFSITNQYVFPRTEVEKTIASVYEANLGVESVGINDNYYEMGGDSIKAIHISSQLMKLGYQISAQDILILKTVKCLAEKIEQEKKAEEISTLEEEVEISPKEYEVLCKHFDEANIKSVIDLTYLQEGMLYHDQAEENSTSYILQNIVRLSGVNSLKTIIQALHLIEKKHDILRTAFLYSGVKKPKQVILSERNIELHTMQTSNLKNQIEEILKADLARGFDLEKDSLLRIYIIEHNNEFYIIWSFHHIIMDGWCSIQILKEFLDYCYCFDNNHTIRLEEDNTFKSYVKWQSENKTQEAEDYWTRLLSGYENTAGIMPMEENPGILEVQRSVYELDDRLSKMLVEFAKIKHCTLNTIFETALGILLQKYNNEEDVVFGKVVSGRNVPLKGIETAIGLFINTIPVRVQTIEGMTCEQLIQEVHHQNLEGMMYHHYPLAELQKFSKMGHDLFSVLLIFENLDEIVMTKENINMELIYSREETNYDLTVSIYLNNRIQIEVLSNQGKYGKKEIDIFVSRMETVLTNLVNQTTTFVKDISIFPQKEIEMVSEQFNQNGAHITVEKDVVKILDNIIIQYQDKIAVKYLDESLTYGELGRQIEHWAEILKNKGVKKGDFVAVVFDRSMELIIAILSIIKAGCAYVPIDINYPNDRILYILEDCKPAFILTNRDRMDFDSGIEMIKVTCVKEEECVSSKECSDGSNLKNIMYMIYTSGTTGRPKGVIVDQSNLLNMIYAYKDIYDLTDADVILQFASIAFDQSVWDIFSALLIGGTLVMMPYEMVGDGSQIANYAKKQKVTVAALTPAFIKELNPEDFETLRILESGGAAADKAVLQKWIGKVRVFNTYGPTETTVNAISYELDRESLKLDMIPIGKPISNSKIYIMNGEQICGVGIPGEICITGCGVARGYYNREKLTNEKFVDNPFGNGKMYRTGDLARWKIDGNIEYLGRIDNQIKIRGFRIELCEIENVLKEMNGIQDAVVCVRQDDSKDNYICAFWVSEDNLKKEEVKQYLKEKLPAYMIPSRMMQVSHIPLTYNGKINYNELPEIENVSVNQYIEPRNEIEKLIAEAYSNVLDIEKVGIEDDFFELGGHSLKALRLVNQLEETTGKRIRVKDIFEYPTIKELGKRLHEYEKKDFFAIHKCEIKEKYNMSSAQKRVYVLQELDRDMTVYNMPAWIKIRGKLNVDKVEDVFQKLIARHESLRTSFHSENNSMYQVIHDNVPFKCSYLECKMEELEQLKLDFIKPFDLSKAPLLRVTIVQIEEEMYYIMFDLHHIVSDGLSIQILVKEFTTFYEGGMLEPLEIGYKDYCEWLENVNFSEQGEYWKHRYKNGIPVLNMPLDYKRPKLQSFRGDIEKKTISVSLSEKIGIFLKRYKVTGFAFFSSVFFALLNKYSNQEDVVIGTAVSGRTHNNTKNLLGMFVNTLILYQKVEDEKIYTEFLNDCQAMCLEAFENQMYQFGDLVDEVMTERDLSRNAGFDVFFSYEDASEEQLKIDGLEIEIEEAFSNVSKFDLSLNVVQLNDVYHLIVQYCTDLYCKESISCFIEHYVTLLNNIISHPEMRLRDIMAYSEQEQIQLLGSNLKEITNENDTILSIFEAAVEKNPNSIAIVAGDVEMTYIQFNSKVNQLARLIQIKGVKREEYVAVYMERSLELVIAIYAIMKAGAAYMPIGINYPRDRIEYMLQDSGACLIITNSKTLQDIDCSNYIIVDMSQEDYFQLQDDNLSVHPKATDLAYMIYTSGTTGMPKGVEVEHHSLKNLILYLQRKYPVEKADAYLLKTSNTFDVSMHELFAWFFNGGKLVVLEKDEEKNPYAICATIRKRKVSHIIFVPSMLNAFLRVIGEDVQADLTSVKYCVACGEMLQYETAVLCKHIFANAKLINLYGPTETTIYATGGEVVLDDKEHILSIGTAIDNYRVYVLDKYQKLSGIGMLGELYIAGEGVTRGYHKKEQLTKQSFVANPYRKNERIYRTGDLARILPNGEIECRGRLDNQVKIRGYRIELGEIENLIRNLSYIDDVAVIARSEKTGERVLCAYFVAKRKVEWQELSNHLLSVLPDYMVPSYFMQVEEIPTTNNGKLDIKALPQIIVKSMKKYVAPTNEIEKIVCDIFGEVLGMEKVGINDNLFELGGNSLKVISIVNHMEKLFGIRVDLRDVFAAPTPKMLASCITVYQSNNKRIISKTSEKEYYCVSPTQKRMFMAMQLDPEGISYNIPGILKIEGDIDVQRIQVVINQIVNRHEAFRTHYTIVDNEIVQIIEENVTIKVNAIALDEHSVNELFEEFIQPFDLNKAPLLRVQLVTISKEESLLFVDMHHIIADEASIDILQHDFISLYQGEELEELQIQYKDYSEWLGQLDLDVQREYWLNQFEDEIPVIDLPYDLPRPRHKTFAGEHVSFELDEEIRVKVKELCSNTGTTEYMVLLAGFMLLLKKYSRQDCIVVGSPIAGRTNQAMEQVIGAFINTIAIKGYPENEKTFENFLLEIKETVIDAFANQELAFNELVELLNIETDTSRNPLFDVMFVYRTAMKQEQRIVMQDGTKLSISRYDNIGGDTAKFDIAVNIIEKEMGYDVVVEYSNDLFIRSSIELMCEHFKNVLDMAVNHPKNAICDITMVSELERRKVLEEFNNNFCDYYRNETIVSLFEETVRKCGNKIAVVCEDKSITYQQLNNQANQLANQLRNAGIQKDQYVAVITKRSVEMIIAIYGVIKSGAAYVPIDPMYPMDRIRYILNDAKVACCVSYGFDEIIDDVTVIRLEKMKWKGEVENLIRVSEPQDAAYVIYTSGSTGKPKGVVVEHRNVMSWYQYFCEEEHIKNGRKLAMNATYCFDASIMAVLGAILSGKEVHVITEEKRIAVRELMEYFEKNEIDMVDATPSLFGVLPFDGIPRTYLIGGEELKTEYIKRALEATNENIILNLYGPSECTVFATSFVISKMTKYLERVPIGRSICNSKIYILNGEELCGVGVPGELCISGNGVSRGYLNLPEETSRKFVLNPFGEGVLYHTGDLAKWMPDGNIDYLGRMDNQIKIRGRRIEIGEIENVIREQKEIEDVVVIKENEEICAYLVANKEISVDAVKTKVKEILPEYMLPVRWMQIERIPVNRNGKVDRKRLPKIEMKRNKRYVEPLTDLEKEVCRIWEHVLEQKEIGTEDDFFEIGGHSIKAVIVVNDLNAKYNITLSVKDIFDFKTIKGLSIRIQELREKQHLIPVTKAVEKDFYILSPAQKRIYVANYFHKECVNYNIPLMLKVHGNLHIDDFEEALQNLVARHEVLRTHYSGNGNEVVQVVEKVVSVKVVYRELSDSFVLDDYFDEFVQPFDLEHGPVIRAEVLKESEGINYLFLDVHHIAFDGSSVGIFIRELMALYYHEKLEPLEYQYKDYAEWIYELRLSESYQKAEQYWLNIFRKSTLSLKLPYDFNSQEDMSFDCSCVELSIKGEWKEKIYAFLQELGISMNMFLIGIYSYTLYNYSGNMDIIIGCPVQGRDRKEWENIIGMFVNMLPIYCQINPLERFVDYMYSIKEQCLIAYENWFYQFDDLIYKLDLEREQYDKSMFNVTFSMQNIELPKLNTNELEIEVLSEIKETKYDIMLYAKELDDEIRLSIDFRTCLFAETTIQRMSDNYLEILKYVIDNPDDCLSGMEVSMRNDKAEIERLVMQKRDNYEIDFDF